MVHQWGFFGSISAIRKIWSLTANSRSLQAAALKTLQLIKKPLFDEHYRSILVTFLGVTEHFSGKNGASRWSILVEKQKHNIQRPNCKLPLTPACLTTCCCLATFPFSDVKQTVFALLPGNRTDTFIDIYKYIYYMDINIFFARIRAALATLGPSPRLIY